jgi:hypothetical protein
MSNENEDMILPDDFVETPEEPASPQAEQETKEEVTAAEDIKPAGTPNTEVVTEPVKVKIKYNHEEQEITLDEAIVLAQKGKNYDKLQEQLNTLKSNPTLSFIEEQAKKFNMTPEQYIETWRANEDEAELIELTNKNVPEEYARELIKGRKIQQVQQTQQQQDEVKTNNDKQMEEFVEAFPSVDASSIKPETWAKVNSGTPLKYAYMEQERADLLNKVKVVEQNKANQDRAPVKGVSEHGSVETAESDPFLDGFDSIK